MTRHLRAVLGLLATLTILNADACPWNGGTFRAWNADTNGDGQLDVVVLGRPQGVVLDLDAMIVIPVPSRAPPLLVESSPGGYIPRVISQAEAVALNPVDNQYTASALAATGATCGSLLLQSLGAGPSLIVGYADTGAVSAIEVLTPGQIGFSMDQYSLTPGDVNGDGVDEIRVTQGAAVRGVMVRAADGRYNLDAAASAIATWDSFVSALRSGNTDLAIAHLSGGASQALAGGIKAAGPMLPAVVADIIDTHLDSVTADSATVNSIVRISAESHRLYRSRIVREGGVWFVDSI